MVVVFFGWFHGILVPGVMLTACDVVAKSCNTPEARAKPYQLDEVAKVEEEASRAEDAVARCQDRATRRCGDENKVARNKRCCKFAKEVSSDFVQT